MFEQRSATMLWPADEPVACGAAEDTAAGAMPDALAHTDLWSCEFAVIDIETTGGVPGRDGITEIAVVRVREGRIDAGWRSFVNPCVPIPSFITGLTGITDDMVAWAPPVRELLPTIVERIGDAVLVGHNVRFDAGFIDFELRRHGRAPLANPTLDTLALARRTVAEVANYRLGTLTAELGFDVERHHRALADARATAQLLVHCIKRLEDQGVFTYGALLDFLRMRAVRKRRPAPRGYVSAAQLPVWTATLRSELRCVPERPGVYLLRDAGEAVVYVGKSRSLRRRLRAYAAAGTRAGGKVCALRSVVASFDYVVTGSELEALLLESELVREHDPPFNDRLRNFREFTFIKVEPGPYGRLVSTTRLVPDGGRYYGPFRSMPSARNAVVALADALGIGCCEREGEACPALPPDLHAALVDDAIAFIEGGADDVMLSVARRRDEAAARNRLEVADREERRLERLRSLRLRHAALEAATGINVIVMAPSAEAAEEACFLFCGGRLVARERLPRRLPQREQAHRLLAGVIAEHYRPAEASRCFARQEEIDQLYILEAWHRERREGLSYVDLPPRTPTPEEARAWASCVLDGEAVAG